MNKKILLSFFISLCFLLKSTDIQSAIQITDSTLKNKGSNSTYSSIRATHVMQNPTLTSIPVGMIVMWASKDEIYDPNKWIECDGRSVNKDRYPELYALMHNVPDYRSFFLRGGTSDIVNKEVEGHIESHDITIGERKDGSVVPHTHDFSFDYSGSVAGLSHAGSVYAPLVTDANHKIFIKRKLTREAEPGEESYKCGTRTVEYQAPCTDHVGGSGEGESNGSGAACDDVGCVLESVNINNDGGSGVDNYPNVTLGVCNKDQIYYWTCHCKYGIRIEQYDGDTTGKTSSATECNIYKYGGDYELKYTSRGNKADNVCQKRVSSSNPKCFYSYNQYISSCNTIQYSCGNYSGGDSGSGEGGSGDGGGSEQELCTYTTTEDVYCAIVEEELSAVPIQLTTGLTVSVNPVANETTGHSVTGDITNTPLTGAYNGLQEDGRDETAPKHKYVRYYIRAER